MLATPAGVIDSLINADEASIAWWRALCAYFLDVVDADLPPMPRACARATAALIIDSPSDHMDYVLKEIIVADLTDCTYFRRAFQWFAYGYLPCGWDGYSVPRREVDTSRNWKSPMVRVVELAA